MCHAVTPIVTPIRRKDNVMPIVFGCEAHSAEEIIAVCRAHGDALRGTYRARYRWNPSHAMYAAATLERPDSLRDNPAEVVFPWEQIFVAAATCAGSDYPMLADFERVPLQAVEFVVAGVFDPRGEFVGLGGYEDPAVASCYVSLHLRTTLRSSAPREQLERIHRRVISRNMVLDGLRGIPRTDELVVEQAG
jgi:hypothetical protein